MIFQTNFKVDDQEDPELAKWLRSFNKKDRVRSYHIRQALKFYLCGAPGLASVIPVNPESRSGHPEPVLIIETGQIVAEKPELSEADILAKLDNLF
jgi:hypothetical protein